jgi:hypothetical protein
LLLRLRRVALLLYRLRSGHGLEEVSLDLMAYPKIRKVKGPVACQEPAAVPRRLGRRAGGSARYGESWIA